MSISTLALEHNDVSLRLNDARSNKGPQWSVVEQSCDCQRRLYATYRFILLVKSMNICTATFIHIINAHIKLFNQLQIIYLTELLNSVESE